MQSANHWPKSDYQSMTHFYGERGQHLTRLRCPYPLMLSWSPSIKVTTITVHEKVADSMDRVMHNVLQLYGKNRITALGLNQWGGCFNMRKIREGHSHSVHSWAAANDWLPTENGLHTPWKDAAFSQPQYIDFLNCWLIEGWQVLGLSWDRDAMHIQATDNDLHLIPSNQYFLHA